MRVVTLIAGIWCVVLGAGTLTTGSLALLSLDKATSQPTTFKATPSTPPQNPQEAWNDAVLYAKITAWAFVLTITAFCVAIGGTAILAARIDARLDQARIVNFEA